LICFVGGLLLTAGGKAATAADTSSLGCDRPIHLAFYEFGSLYHQGVGIDPDVISELARRTGCKFEIQALPREQIWQQLQSGDLDMATSGVTTELRHRFAYFIPYMGLTNAIVAKADLASAIHSFDDVVEHPEWRLGVVKGYSYGPYFDYRLRAIVNRSRVIAYPDEQAMYRALQNGDIQMLLSPSVSYPFYLPLTDQERMFVLVDVSPAPPMPYALVFSHARFTAPMINAWMRVLEQMRLDGTLKQIYLRRLLPSLAQNILRY
jgi:polar amino acid transport system substrate-binding protein